MSFLASLFRHMKPTHVPAGFHSAVNGVNRNLPIALGGVPSAPNTTPIPQQGPSPLSGAAVDAATAGAKNYAPSDVPPQSPDNSPFSGIAAAGAMAGDKGSAAPPTGPSIAGDMGSAAPVPDSLPVDQSGMSPLEKAIMQSSNGGFNPKAPGYGGSMDNSDAPVNRSPMRILSGQGM